MEPTLPDWIPSAQHSKAQLGVAKWHLGVKQNGIVRSAGAVNSELKQQKVQDKQAKELRGDRT